VEIHIRNFVFIAGVVDTSNKLFNDVNNTCDKSINLSPVTTPAGMKQLQEYQPAYTSK
jgi:hypothetical protein